MTFFKRSLLLLSLCFISLQTFAQQVDWVNNGGGSSWDVGGDITSDDAGNSYAVGTSLANVTSFSRWGNDTLNTTNVNLGYQGFIVKHDIRGNRNWLISMGGTGTDLGTSIEMDSDTTFIVCGLYNSASPTFDTISGPSGSFAEVRMYLARYDTSGGILWLETARVGQSIVTPFNQLYWPKISINDDGTIGVAGIFRGRAIFGSDTLTAASTFDYDNYVAKYDNVNGTRRWVRSFGGAGFNFSGGIAVDNNDNFYVTGFFTGSTTIDTISVTATGSRDIYVAQYNDTGRVQWAIAEGGTGADDAYGIAVDKFDNLYVGGSFQGSFTFDTVSVNNLGGSGFLRDIYLVRMTTGGRALWAEVAGGTTNNNDFLFALDTDDRGNVGLTGEVGGATATFGTQTITGTGAFRSIFFALADSTGDFSWAVSGSGSSFAFNRGNGITLDTAKNIYATGQGDPPLVFDNVVWATGAGLRDAFVIKISDCVDADTAEIYGPTTLAGCLGDTFRLTSNNNPALDYQWTINNTPVIFQTDSVYEAYLTGDYRVVIIDDGCIDTSNALSVTVNALPNVTLSNFTPICSGQGRVTLTQGSPIGGSYAGLGMINDTVFDPDTSGTGTFGIWYTYEDTSTSCSDSAFKQLQVINVTASLSPYTPVCTGDANFTLTGGTPAGGTYYVNGVSSTSFSPSTQGAGTDTIEYVLNSSGCTDTATQIITVNTSPTASLTAFSPVCASTASITLSGGSPAGGTFSGPGVAFGSFFFPAFAGGAGTYNINYVVDNSGCADTATQSIQVDPAFTISFNPSQTVFCLDGDNDTLTASPSGGVFSGTGIIGGNIFSPSTATVGTWPIKYRFSNACGADSVIRNFEVSTGPTASISAISAICEGNNAITLTQGSPAGGTYFGTGVSSGQFDPGVSGDGTFTIFYAITDTNGCSDTANTSITVHPQPNVTLSALSSVCVDASSFALSGGSPAGGAYSGTGVTGGTTFNPGTAGVGTFPITYTFTDANTCTDSATQNQVVDPLPTVSFSTISDLCANSSPITLSQGSPAGGTYSGTGVSGGQFNPSTSGVGTFTLTYSFTDGNGCSDDATQTVTVDTIPSVSLGAISSLCAGSSAITLTQGSPSGGTYFGSGVTGTSFNPASAGAGTTQIGYTFVDGNSCTDTAFTNVTINAQPNVTLSALSSVCVDASSFTLSGGSPAGGTYSGTGVTGGTTFNPGTAGVGSFTITYTYTDANTCTDSATQNQVVDSLPIVSFSSISNLCADASAITLTQGSPVGGTYSGTGVSGGQFDPSVAGAGTFTLTYSFTDGNGCSDDATQTVTVDTLPSVSLGSISALCAGSNSISLSQGSPSGGTYFGTGVTGTSFNPATAGAGTTQIGYTFVDGNGCTDTAFTNVTINAQPNVTLSALSSVCVDASSFALSGGSPAGGTYSGTGVTGGTTFNPGTAGVGSFTITYTYTDANTCTDSATQNQVVDSLPSVSFSSISNLCADAAAVTLTQGSPVGGTYSGTGVSGGQFDPAVSSVGTFTLTYSYTDGNGCNDDATQTITVDSLPIVNLGAISALCAGSDTISLSQGSPSGGTYFGTGVTGTSFNPTTAGAGTTQMGYTFVDGNGCTDTAFTSVTINAQPTVSFSALSNLCENSNNITLSQGSPLGGTYSGTGVSGSNFNPSTATSGTYTLTYLFTDVNSCTDSATQTITVDTVPIVQFSSLNNICGNSNTISLSQGTPAGGVYSGTGVLGATFDPVISGIGTFNLKYVFSDANSCADSAFQNIGVDTIPTVTFGALSNICFGTSPISISTGSPLGGVYSGAAIVNGLFDPSIAGAGIDTIQYRFTNLNGCADSVIQTILVDSLPNVQLSSQADICANTPAFQLSNGSPIGGTYSGLRISSDSLIAGLVPGSGTDSITYTFTNVNGCTDSASVNFSIDTVPNLSFGPILSQCFGNPSIILNQGAPVGGTYSGQGVSGSNFDPSLGLGNFAITYTFTDANSCTDSAFSSVNVDTLPVVVFPALSNQCIGSGDIALSLASPAGGIYSGDGVRNGNIFNADSASVLNPSIKYIFTDLNSCVDSSSQTLLIDTLPLVSLVIPDTICLSSGVVNLSGGAPSGGIYKGAAVFSDSLFDPLINGVGVTSVKYLFTNQQGCTDSSEYQSFVNPDPSSGLSLNTQSLCSNDTVISLSGGTPAGGVYLGVGVTGAQFNPSITRVPNVLVSYVSSNFCGSDTASATLRVNAPVPLSATTKDYCEDDGLISLNMVSPFGGVYIGEGLSQDSILNTSTLDTGSYTFQYVYSDGTCSDTISASLVINENPELGLNYDTTICAANQIVLSIDSSFTDVIWNGLPGTNVFAIPAQNLSMGENRISLRVQEGGLCSSKDTFLVNVEPCAQILLRPNPSNGVFSLDVNMGLADELKLTITNNIGQAILNQTVSVQKGMNNLPFDFPSLGAGIYVIKVKGEFVDYSDKLIIR